MKKCYFFLIMTFHCISLLYAITPQEKAIAQFCRARKLVLKRAPTESPIVQAIDAEEQVEEEKIAPEESEEAEMPYLQENEE